MSKVGEAPANPAARWVPRAALAAAAIVVLGPAIQLASHVIEPTKTETLDRLEWIAGNTGAANAAKALDLVALPFLLGTALIYVLLSRQRAPRLAYTGGILLGTGLVGLAAVEGFETLAFILVEDGRFGLTELADVVENQMASGPGLVMMLMFLLPAFFGLVMLAVALWKSQAVPRGAVVLIVAAFLVDGVLVEGGGAPHWIPHAISLVAGVWIAWTILQARRETAT